MSYKFAYTSDITEWSPECDTLYKLAAFLYNELGTPNFNENILIYDLDTKNLVYLSDFFIKYDKYKFIKWEEYCLKHNISSETRKTDQLFEKYFNEVEMLENTFMTEFLKELKSYIKEKEEEYDCY